MSRIVANAPRLSNDVDAGLRRLPAACARRLESGSRAGSVARGDEREHARWLGRPFRCGWCAIAACVLAVVLVASMSESQSGRRCVQTAVAGPCTLWGGHGGGPAIPLRDGCPAMLDAEGPVEEVDLRDAALRWAGTEACGASSAVPGAGGDRTGAAAETALVAAAADLSRLCRRLL